ncbi:hypothetical protein X777_02649 [Ooceraea biroi]|uniref:CCHC-type domain-containing protein n=1 Tax=Ooceraea biroi TaxID=2015173 RepID=A0A026WNY4_OOCBI|nr:hypothetical protein X777_02649 [Ooceraea biroi]
METRSKASKPLSEAEIEELQSQLRNKEKQLREQAAALESQQNEFETQKDAAEHDLREIRTSLENKELELRERDARNNKDPAEETLRENAELKRELARLRATALTEPLPLSQQPTVANPTHYWNTPAMFPSQDSWAEPPAPRVYFREILETVPHFDGYNVTVTQFTRACRRAKETVPASSERSLTRMLVNKLRGRAYSAVEGVPCDTIAQLADLLNRVFGEKKTVRQYHGDLSYTYWKTNEHIFDYIDRVKDLHSCILDEERRQRGDLTNDKVAEIDAEVAEAFCKGLPPEFRMQLSNEHYVRPLRAYSRAIDLAKQREIDKERFEPRRNERIPEGHRIPFDNRPITYATRDRLNEYRRNSDHDRRIPQRENTPVYDRTGPIVNKYRDNRPRGDTNRYGNEQLRRDRPETRQETPIPERKWCRYCKNAGHEIEECRKRQYNNAQRESGNAARHSGNPDETRAGPSREPNRPIRTIATEAIETPESQC